MIIWRPNRPCAALSGAKSGRWTVSPLSRLQDTYWIDPEPSPFIRIPPRRPSSRGSYLTHSGPICLAPVTGPGLPLALLPLDRAPRTPGASGREAGSRRGPRALPDSHALARIPVRQPRCPCRASALNEATTTNGLARNPALWSSSCLSIALPRIPGASGRYAGPRPRRGYGSLPKAYSVEDPRSTKSSETISPSNAVPRGVGRVLDHRILPVT